MRDQLERTCEHCGQAIRIPGPPERKDLISFKWEAVCAKCGAMSRSSLGRAWITSGLTEEIATEEGLKHFVVEEDGVERQATEDEAVELVRHKRDQEMMTEQFKSKVWNGSTWRPADGLHVA